MNKIYFALITGLGVIVFLFYFQSPSEETSDTVDLPSQKIIVNAVEIGKSSYNFDEHPCLCLTSPYTPLNSTPKYYDETKYYKDSDFNVLDLFHILTESSIMFNDYSEFMQTLESILIRKKIDHYLNPKYHFILALKNLHKGDFENANNNLKDFLTVTEDYQSGKRAYFDLGCYEKDIEWMLNHKQTRLYKIAMLLLDYSKSKSFNNSITAAKVINELKNHHDNTPDQYDLVENIIFTLLKAEKSSTQGIVRQLSLDNNPRILYSSIDEMFEDGNSYFLPSQLEMISLSKYYQSKKIYEEFDWEKIIANLNVRPKPFPDWKIKLKHIFSLMHFYELKMELFDEQDTVLYGRIKTIVEGAKGLKDLSLWIESYSPNQPFYETKIGQIKKMFKDGMSPNEFIDLINGDYLSVPGDFILYLTIRDLLINKDIFKIISSNSTAFVIPEPIKEYKTEINKFLDIFSNQRKSKFKKYPKAFDLQTGLANDYYSIFDMNDLDGAIDVSARLYESKDIKNEGNDPVSEHWDTVRSYIEAKTFIIQKDNRCK